MLKGGNSLVPVTVKINIVHGYWYCDKWIMYNLIKSLRIPHLKIASQCLAFSTKCYEAFKENWASNQIGFQLWIPLYCGTLCFKLIQFITSNYNYSNLIFYFTLLGLLFFKFCLGKAISGPMYDKFGFLPCFSLGFATSLLCVLYAIFVLKVHF